MNLTKGVFIRLTDEDYYTLSKMAAEDPSSRNKNGTVNLSAFCRMRLLANTNIKNVTIQRSVEALTYQVRKIGNNINQIAKSVNAGFATDEDIEKAIDLTKQLSDEVDTYIEEVGRLWESQN